MDTKQKHELQQIQQLYFQKSSVKSKECIVYDPPRKTLVKS